MDMFAQQDIYSQFYLAADALGGRVGRSRGNLISKMFACLQSDVVLAVMKRHNIDEQAFGAVLRQLEAAYPVKKVLQIAQSETGSLTILVVY